MVWNVRVFHVLLAGAGVSRGGHAQRHPRGQLKREPENGGLFTVALGPEGKNLPLNFRNCIDQNEDLFTTKEIFRKGKEKTFNQNLVTTAYTVI